MCWMLGAAHYEYQYYIQQPGEAGGQIVAVSLKPSDLKSNGKMENIGKYSQEDKDI